jgi:hypothetical protein
MTDEAKLPTTLLLLPSKNYHNDDHDGDNTWDGPEGEGYTSRKTLKQSIDLSASCDGHQCNDDAHYCCELGSGGGGGGGTAAMGYYRVSVGDTKRFRLEPEFVASFSNEKPSFGYNGLGEFVFVKTYSRVKPDGNKERWFETVARVVEGTYNMQKDWIDRHGLGWRPAKAQRSAQEMYRLIFDMKFLPPGRGLWAMGSSITEERKLYAALNNCAFVSTKDMRHDPAKPFCFLMDMSMLGVGVGFDTVGAGSVVVKESRIDHQTVDRIADSREGWVHSVWMLLDSYLVAGRTCPVFDYSLIRPAGQLIRGFGGVSCGPDCLRGLHEDLRACLDKEAGKPISVTTIVDIMNLIGKCVVSGNVRPPPAQPLVQLKSVPNKHFNCFFIFHGHT